MQRPAFAGEDRERRRPDRVLRNVINLPFLEAQLLDEAVQLAGRDAARRRLVNLADQREQLLQPRAALGGEEHGRRVVEELERIAYLLLELALLLAPVAFDLVPFVD